MSFFPRLFRNRHPNKAVPERTPAHESTTSERDPLDPHGDGTIREGDAMYDLLMGAGSYGAVVGTRNDDGTWDLKSYDAPAGNEDNPPPRASS